VVDNGMFSRDIHNMLEASISSYLECREDSGTIGVGDYFCWKRLIASRRFDDRGSICLVSRYRMSPFTSSVARYHHHQ